MPIKMLGIGQTPLICWVSDSVTRQDAQEMLGLRYRYAKQQNS